MQNLIGYSCLPEPWYSILAGVDFSTAPSTWSDEVCQALGEVDEQLNIAEEVLFMATGEQWPGACRAVIQPRRSGLCHCGGGCRWACERADELNLWLPYPILTVDPIADPCGDPFYARYIADIADEIPTPLVRGVDTNGVSWAWRPHTDLNVIEPCTLAPWETDCQVPYWPTQAINRRPTDPGTWVIETVYGAYPPLTVLMATARLASAFLKRVCGAKDCPLPDGVTSVTTHGTTMRLTSSGDWLQLSKTLDRWVSGIVDIDTSIAPFVGPPPARVLPPRDQRWQWISSDQIHALWRAIPVPAQTVCA